MKQTIIRISKIGLPLLFIIYMSSVSLFYHVHVINGVTIVHSHPFHSDKDQPTASQIQLINQLNHVILLDTVLENIIPEIESHPFCTELLITDIKQTFVSKSKHLFLRGPPTLSLFQYKIV